MASVMMASTLNLGEFSVLQRVQGAKPPHPAGDAADYFPYSAQTAPHRSGNGTHSLSVALEKPVYRPGDQLSGTLSVGLRTPTPSDPGFLNVRRVDLRVYCESRSMFWNYALLRDGSTQVLKEVYDDLDLPPEDALEEAAPEPSPALPVEPAVELPRRAPPSRLFPASLPRPRSTGALAALASAPNPSLQAPPPPTSGRGAPEGDLAPAHEWHRLFADRQTLEFAALERHPAGFMEVPLASARWPFRVQLPTRSRHVHECNSFRGGPRDLQRVNRPLPPSCRDNRNGSVEWVVEAVVTLQGEGDGPEDEPELELDERGMLKPSRTHLVSRQVFELVAAPPAGAGPASGYFKLPRGFSDDSLARVHGAVLARPDGAFDPMSGRIVCPDRPAVLPVVPPWIPGGDDGWRRFARAHRIEAGVFSRKIGRLRFEIALPEGGWFRKGAKQFRWRTWMMWEGRNGNKDRAGRRREVWTEGFEAVISRRTLTRGGADRKAHQLSEPVRHAFFPAKRLLAPGVANQFSFDLDLQSTEPSPAPFSSRSLAPECTRQLPLRTLCPSFRLPNFERDLVLQIWVRFAAEHPYRPGQEEVQQIANLSLVRISMHLFEEEQEELPAFETAVGYRPRPPLYTPEKPEWEGMPGEGGGDGDVTPRAERSRAPSYRTEASSRSANLDDE